MEDIGEGFRSADGIAPEIIRVAVARISASVLFDRIVRVSELLRFLAEAYIGGQNGEVSFEVLRPALYEDYSDEVAERLMRADAVRLAGLLESYFAEEGRLDALIFQLDPSALKLQLTSSEKGEARASEPKRAVWYRNWTIATALVIVIVALWSGVVPRIMQSAQSEASGKDVTPASIDQSLFQQPKSALLPATEALENPTAATMDAIGRDHMFSFMNLARQKRVVAHSWAVIARYPEYGPAYATAAHSLSSLAVLTRGSSSSRAFLEEAHTMSARAQSLAPNDPWTVSAGGWVAAASRDWPRAVQLSTQAFELSDAQHEILVFHALILLFSGDFESAARVTAPDEAVPGSGDIGIHGFAKFYLQDYQGAVEAFEQAARLGGDPTPVGAAYVAAVYQALGRTDEAARVVLRIKNNWPGFRPGQIHQVFAPQISAENEHIFLKLFREAGWSEES